MHIWYVDYVFVLNNCFSLSDPLAKIRGSATILKNIETKERTNLVETFAVISVLAKAVHKIYP